MAFFIFQIVVYFLPVRIHSIWISRETLDGLVYFLLPFRLITNVRYSLILNILYRVGILGRFYEAKVTSTYKRVNISIWVLQKLVATIFNDVNR